MSLLNFEWLVKSPREAGDSALLQVEHISVRVGQRLVLDDVSLEVFAQDQVRITGANGAGKTTLFNAIAGLVPLSAGRILFQGLDIARLVTHERVALGISYMRQRDNVFPALSVRENLELALGSGGFQRFVAVFPEWAADIPADKMAGMLSGGQKQKVAWAMCVLQKPKLFLSDEAAAGMSHSLLFEKNQSVLFIEHI